MRGVRCGGTARGAWGKSRSPSHGSRGEDAAGAAQLGVQLRVVDLAALHERVAPHFSPRVQVLGARERHGHVADARQSSGVHAGRYRRLARVRCVLQFSDRRSGESVRHRHPASGWTGTESAAAEPHPHDHSSAVPLSRIRRHDDSVRTGLCGVDQRSPRFVVPPAIASGVDGSVDLPHGGDYARRMVGV